MFFSFVYYKFSFLLLLLLLILLLFIRAKCLFRSAKRILEEININKKKLNKIESIKAS